MTCLGGLYTAAMFSSLVSSLMAILVACMCPCLCSLSCVMFDVLSDDYCRASMCRFVWMQGVVDDIMGYCYVASISEVSSWNEKDIYIRSV